MMFLEKNASLGKDSEKNAISDKNSSEKKKQEKKLIENCTNVKKETHKYCINCLFKCSNYKLNLTISQKKKNIGYHFPSNDIFFFRNISSESILKLLEEKESTESYNISYKNIIQNINNNNNNSENILLEKLNFPIENLNKITDEISIWEDFSFTLKSGNENTNCLLIEFNLDNCNEQNKYFKEINKNFLKNEINCILNGIVHEREILKKDICFSIDPKKLVKSIELRIENYKKEKRNLSGIRNLFFAKIFKQKNLGFVFGTNNKEDLLNIENLQTNFNSIVSKQFYLVKLFVAINVPNSIPNKIDEKEKEKTNYSTDYSSKGIQNLSNFSDEIPNYYDSNSSFYDTFNDNISDTCSFKSYYPNNVSYSQFFSNNQLLYNHFNNNQFTYNEYKNNNFFNNNLKNNKCEGFGNNNLYNNNGNINYLTSNDNNMFNNNKINYFTNPYYGINNLNMFQNGLTFNNNLFNYYNAKNKKVSNYNTQTKLMMTNSKIKKIKNDFPDNLHYEPIIIDSKNRNNLFEIFIFKKYKTRSFSVSNFLIFKKIMKLLFSHIGFSMTNLTFHNFAKIFQKLSLFGIKIPLINNNGKYISTAYSPSLSSITLYIKHTELYIFVFNSLNKMYNQRNCSSTVNIFANNNNCDFLSHNQFIELNENLKLSLLNQFIILEYNETKPHYLRNTLYEQLNIIFNLLPKTLNEVKVNNIDFTKSFFSILWNPVNIILNQTSFITYYLFTSDLIGILPIKLECRKWLTKIGLEKKENIIRKENEINDSIIKVESFLMNNSLFNSYDYEFYCKNKIFSLK